MTRTFATAAILVALVPSAAFAQHRAGDAALGALSGAVVLGPVGAVAGAVIGYSAGPAIAHSWGLNGSRSKRDRRYSSRDARRAVPAGPAGAGAGTATASNASADRMDSNARIPAPAASTVNSSAPVAKPDSVVTEAPPPVQTFE